MAFPEPSNTRLYLAEGGQETEIMYRHGHALPHFAMFTLLEKPQAVADMQDMYRRYLDTAASHGFAALIGGLDYRASPDWGDLLGYSREGLADLQLAAIEFLREVAQPYSDQLPDIRIAGCVGPRGDAYSLNQSITAEEAEDYHSVQIATLKQAKVDLVSAMTLNSVAEAVGIARAASTAGLPVCIGFTLDSRSRLQSGPTLREAIEAVDREAGDSKPDFFGINCSHPAEFEPALEPGDWIQRIRSLRPNAALMDKIELCQLGHLEEGDPRELGELMGDLARRYPHIDIWGGCCGTWDKHLDAIAGNVLAARQRPREPAEQLDEDDGPR